MAFVSREAKKMDPNLLMQYKMVNLTVMACLKCTTLTIQSMASKNKHLIKGLRCLLAEPLMDYYYKIDFYTHKLTRVTGRCDLFNQVMEGSVNWKLLPWSLEP